MGKRTRHYYSEEFKLEVMSYLYSHDGNIVKTREKFGLSKYNVKQWLKKYSYDGKTVSLQSENAKTDMKGKPEEPSTEENLRKKIAELEKAVEFERMRSRAYEKMIEIAEKEEHISILKKDGAKQ